MAGTFCPARRAFSTEKGVDVEFQYRLWVLPSRGDSENGEQRR